MAARIGLGGLTPKSPVVEDPPIPTGIIVMWTGLLADIPTGWALCNGIPPTPDLRKHFVKKDNLVLIMKL